MLLAGRLLVRLAASKQLHLQKQLGMHSLPGRRLIPAVMAGADSCRLAPPGSGAAPRGADAWASKPLLAAAVAGGAKATLG